MRIEDVADDLTASDEVKSKPLPDGALSFPPDRAESEEKSPSRDSQAETEPLVSHGNGRSQSTEGAPSSVQLRSVLSISISRQFSSRDSALADTLVVNGKQCDVSLSEDKIIWTNKKGTLPIKDGGRAGGGGGGGGGRRRRGRMHKDTVQLCGRHV